MVRGGMIWPPPCSWPGCVAHYTGKAPRGCRCKKRRAWGGGTHLTALDGRCTAHVPPLGMPLL